jgi:hypothetical protein
LAVCLEGLKGRLAEIPSVLQRIAAIETYDEFGKQAKTLRADVDSFLAKIRAA